MQYKGLNLPRLNYTRISTGSHVFRNRAGYSGPASPGLDSHLVRLTFPNNEQRTFGTSDQRRYFGDTNNMTWQDIVAEKRRVQVEAVTQFAASRGKTESEKLDGSVHLPKSVNDGEIVRQIANEQISCETLTESRIRK